MTLFSGNAMRISLASMMAAVLIVTSPVALAEPRPPETERIIDAFIDSEEIELLDWTYLDEETDPNHLLGRPNQYIAKVIFWDAEIGDPELDEASGTVEIFRNDRDLLNRMRYIEEIGRKIPMVVQYQVRKGRALLRLDKQFTPADVERYTRILKTVK